jgi:hypothetical protein
MAARNCGQYPAGLIISGFSGDWAMGTTSLRVSRIGRLRIGYNSELVSAPQPAFERFVLHFL